MCHNIIKHSFNENIKELIRLFVNFILKWKTEIFYKFSTLRIFYTPHFPHPAFSTLLIFHTPHFPHSAFSTLRTPRFPLNRLHILIVYFKFPLAYMPTPPDAIGVAIVSWYTSSEIQIFALNHLSPFTLIPKQHACFRHCWHSCWQKQNGIFFYNSHLVIRKSLCIFSVLPSNCIYILVFA